MKRGFCFNWASGALFRELPRAKAPGLSRAEFCNFADVYQRKTYLSEHLDMDSIRKVDSVFYRDFVTDYSESGFISSNMYDIVIGQPVVKCYYSGGGQCQIPIPYTRVWQGDHGAGMQSQVVTDYYDIFLTDDYKVWDAHFFRSETA